jgi:Uncharacterized protein conserved in bacteria
MTDPPGELGADPAVTPRIMSAITLDPAIHTAAAPTRQPAVDRMRLLAILAVIVIHCNPFLYPLFHSPVEQLAEIVLARLARFAVPFFFVVSGYFLGRALARGDAPMATLGRRTRRLAMLFFAWSLFYLLVPVHLDELMKHGYLTDRLHLLHDYQLLSQPWMWLLQGTAAHLWFLPSLLMAIAIVAVAERLSLPGLVLPLGAALYLFGLLAGPYGHTPLGLRPGFDPVLRPVLQHHLRRARLGAGARASAFAPARRLDDGRCRRVRHRRGVLDPAAARHAAAHRRFRPLLVAARSGFGLAGAPRPAIRGCA